MAHGYATPRREACLESSTSQIPPKALSQIAPYELPSNDPIRQKLDRLFNSKEVLLNMKTLRAAGFVASNPRKFTKIITATHPDFPGYFFKLFIDAQRYEQDMPLHEYWIRRIEGARLIQKEIIDNGWQHLFKVPRKWIYAVQKKPSRHRDFLSKDFIIIEDKMDVYPDSENRALWKSDRISYEMLHAYFLLVKKLGFSDIKPENTPLTRDGRIAFIDTQSYFRSVNYERINPVLSPRNKAYWKEIQKLNKSE